MRPSFGCRSGCPGDADDREGRTADRLPIGYQWLKAGLVGRRRVDFAAALERGRRALALSALLPVAQDRKSTRLNSSHRTISYAVFCLKKKKQTITCTVM